LLRLEENEGLEDPRRTLVLLAVYGALAGCVLQRGQGHSEVAPGWSEMVMTSAPAH